MIQTWWRTEMTLQKLTKKGFQESCVQCQREVAASPISLFTTSWHMMQFLPFMCFLFWFELLNPCFISWFAIISLCFFPFVSSWFFFLSSTRQSHPAYLDDEDDEDPFGDYVISKWCLIMASCKDYSADHRPIRANVIVFEVLLCSLGYVVCVCVLFTVSSISWCFYVRGSSPQYNGL